PRRQTQTLKRLRPMSALPPKADIAERGRHVRFVPKADMCSAAIRDVLEQVLTNFCQQVARAVRLRHVVITSRCSRYTFFPIQRMRGDGDDGDRSQRGIGLDLARDRVAVHDRQVNTHQDEIGPLLRDSCERLLGVFGLGDFTIDTAKHIANNLAIIFLVLHHQYAFAHAAGSTCRSTTTGSVKENVEPWPGCDSTQILPPCISMMRLDIASPKPVPPFLRVMALSACWNS